MSKQIVRAKLHYRLKLPDSLMDHPLLKIGLTQRNPGPKVVRVCLESLLENSNGRIEHAGFHIIFCNRDKRSAHLFLNHSREQSLSKHGPKSCPQPQIWDHVLKGI